MGEGVERGGESALLGCLYLSDVFAFHLRPFDLPFVSEDGEQ